MWWRHSFGNLSSESFLKDILLLKAQECTFNLNWFNEVLLYKYVILSCTFYIWHFPVRQEQGLFPCQNRLIEAITVQNGLGFSPSLSNIVSTCRPLHHYKQCKIACLLPLLNLCTIISLGSMCFGSMQNWINTSIQRQCWPPKTISSRKIQFFGQSF